MLLSLELVNSGVGQVAQKVLLTQYFPFAHGLHCSLTSWLALMDPALHGKQGAFPSDPLAYPALHLQSENADELIALVLEKSGQAMHDRAAVTFEKLPTGHGTQPTPAT